MAYIDSVAKARGGRTPLPSSRRHIDCAARRHQMKVACRAHFNGSGVNPCLFIPLSVDINLRHFVFEYNERLSFSSTLFVVRRDQLPPKWLTKWPWSASTPITCTWRFCIINKRRTNQNSFYNLDEDYFEREAEREARFAGIEARNHWGENMACSQTSWRLWRMLCTIFCVLFTGPNTPVNWWCWFDWRHSEKKRKMLIHYTVTLFIEASQFRLTRQFEHTQSCPDPHTQCCIGSER